jgi:hypothetical protein
VSIIGVRTTAVSAKFRCLCAAVDYYYDDGGEGTLQGSLLMGKEATTNSYEGHVFFFTEKGNKKKEIARFKISRDKVLYVVQDKNKPPPAKYLEALKKEEQFGVEYLNRTGVEWRHYYGPDGPRPPPKLHMWSAKEVGEKHEVTSTQGINFCVY